MNMELFAWKIRAWWLWYPLPMKAAVLPPAQNFAAWFAAAAVFAVLLQESRVTVNPRGLTKATLILLLTNALFLTANIAAGLRR